MFFLRGIVFFETCCFFVCFFPRFSLILDSWDLQAVLNFNPVFHPLCFIFWTAGAGGIVWFPPSLTFLIFVFVVFSCGLQPDRTLKPMSAAAMAADGCSPPDAKRLKLHGSQFPTPGRKTSRLLLVWWFEFVLVLFLVICRRGFALQENNSNHRRRSTTTSSPL